MKLRRRYADEYIDPAPASTADEMADTPEEDATPPDWREESSGDTEPEGDEDKTDNEQPVKRKRGIRLGQFFTGGVLDQDEFTRRLPVIVYIVFLMLLYIANGFHIQHKHSRLDQISDELKQLKTVAVTSSAVRMTNTRQSEIERLLREHNIPLSQEGVPPHMIENQARRR